MKVWYVLMTFPVPSETFVANDVRALVRHGVDVSVHALRGPRSDAEYLLKERGLSSLRVTHGTLKNLLRGLTVAVRRPLRALDLAAWVLQQSGGRAIHILKGLALLPRILDLFDDIQRERPDVIHIYWGHYPAILGWLVLDQAPSVIVSLSLSAYDLLVGFPGSGAVARKAHLVSTWAATNVPAITRLGLESGAVHVNWQGVDVERVRQRLSDKVRYRVVSVGRLHADKGMDDVIRAFARIVSEQATATLVVLGDGPDRDRLEELAFSIGIAAAVTFRGHVSQEEVFDELSRAEVFLFLSRSPAERLPNVVKEAMACRCVVVTTVTPGIEELIEDGVDGFLVEQGDWLGAADRAVHTFAHPKAAQTIAAAGHASIVSRFDLDLLMQQMIVKWRQCRTGVTETPVPRIVHRGSGR